MIVRKQNNQDRKNRGVNFVDRENNNSVIEEST